MQSQPSALSKIQILHPFESIRKINLAIVFRRKIIIFGNWSQQRLRSVLVKYLFPEYFSPPLFRCIGDRGLGIFCSNVSPNCCTIYVVITGNQEYSLLRTTSRSAQFAYPSLCCLIFFSSTPKRDVSADQYSRCRTKRDDLLLNVTDHIRPYRPIWVTGWIDTIRSLEMNIRDVKQQHLITFPISLVCLLSQPRSMFRNAIPPELRLQSSYTPHGLTLHPSFYPSRYPVSSQSQTHIGSSLQLVVRPPPRSSYNNRPLPSLRSA